MPLSNPSGGGQISGTVTVTAVNAFTANTSLLAANPNRKGASFWNASTSPLFIEYGTNAANDSYAVTVLPNGYFELPFGFTGAVNGVWNNSNGHAEVREFT